MLLPPQYWRSFCGTSPFDIEGRRKTRVHYDVSLSASLRKKKLWMVEQGMRREYPGRDVHEQRCARCRNGSSNFCHARKETMMKRRHARPSAGKRCAL
jgi:hypothetical protein